MSYLPDDPSGGGFVEEAAAEDLSRIDDERLEASIPALLRHIDAMQAQLTLRVAEYHRRGLAESTHALSTKQWLAHRCRITKPHAASLLHTGRSLAATTHVREAALTGAITSVAVKKLTAARDRHPRQFPLHDGVLAEAATYLDPAELQRAIQHWEQQVDHPSAVAQVKAKRDRRRLSISQTWDGMWALTGELDPETGSMVSTALNAHIEQSNLDPSDRRSHRQKMADALADLSQHHLDHHTDHATGGQRPHLTVTVEFDTLRADIEKTALPELDGLPVHPHTVRKLACDSTLIPMVLGADGDPLDIGRATRVVPPAIRRALEHRHGGCSWLGCDLPAPWCDAHHIHHWADGGPTSLENLTLLCRRHHTAVHEGRTQPAFDHSGSDPPAYPP
ncbi:MAG: DUF222 domain-containing protein [Acidimicrobiia bacterium]|nr:DUF222 domain-containing protein [Acidimicrobiia bacterium]